MTCAEAQAIRSRPPEDATLAEVAATTAHIRACPTCMARHTARVEASHAVLSPEQFAQVERAGQAIADEIKRKLRADPETGCQDAESPVSTRRDGAPPTA